MSIGCKDCRDAGDLSHARKRYRRALSWVVVLNLGMGGVQLTGGLFGMSQSLKADALDFLGDGFITWLGLLSVSHTPRWRARTARMLPRALAAQRSSRCVRSVCSRCTNNPQTRT